jgi:hypothetical protein
LIAILLSAATAAQTTATSTFAFSRADYPGDSGARAVVSGDFDGDGAPDFATANAGSNTVDVFMNREFAGGGFAVQRHAVGAGPFDLAAADFNFDGYPDLVVAAADADEIDVLFGGAGGHFAAPVRLDAPGSPRGVATGYFGSNGYSIVYSSYNSGTDEYLTGIGDIDGNGTLDLVIWNAPLQQIGAWLGDGTGQFPTEQLAPSAGAFFSSRVGRSQR